MRLGLSNGAPCRQGRSREIDGTCPEEIHEWNQVAPWLIVPIGLLETAQRKGGAREILRAGPLAAAGCSRRNGSHEP